MQSTIRRPSKNRAVAENESANICKYIPKYIQSKYSDKQNDVNLHFRCQINKQTKNYTFKTAAIDFGKPSVRTKPPIVPSMVIKSTGFIMIDLNECQIIKHLVTGGGAVSSDSTEPAAFVLF